MLTSYSTARIIAKIAGKIESIKYVTGNIVRLKTRSIYKTIQIMRTWDNKFNYLYYHATVDEILFWRKHCKRLNKRSIYPYSIPRYMLFSDASSTVVGVYFTMNLVI